MRLGEMTPEERRLLLERGADFLSTPGGQTVVSTVARAAADVAAPRYQAEAAEWQYRILTETRPRKARITGRDVFYVAGALWAIYLWRTR